MIRAESGLVGMGTKLLLRVLKASLVRKAGSMVSRFSSGTEEYWMEYCGKLSCPAVVDRRVFGEQGGESSCCGCEKSIIRAVLAEDSSGMVKTGKLLLH